MACNSMQELIERLEDSGELCRIKERVEPELELSDITIHISKTHGPALLFEQVGDFSMPVLSNAFGSVQRICTAMGIDDLESKAATLHREIKTGQGPYPQVPRTSSVSPASAPCREIVLEGQDVDLSILPIPLCWIEDAAPAITLPAVFTRDPDTGIPNCGMYRMQILDTTHTGMHWYRGTGGASHYEKACRRGEPLAAAVAIGPDPAITIAACTPLPENIYEIDFAAMLTDAPVAMTPCLHSDLQVPASSQIVIEGMLYPDSQHTEGPFGTHTGYYSRPESCPVFHVTCVSMRKDAIYPTTVVGPPPQEDCFMAKVVERLLLPFIRESIPGIVDLSFPVEGIFSRIAFVSIDKQYPGHPKDVMNALWHMGKGLFSKMIWVFDSDVNVHCLSEVLWKMTNCVDPGRDVVIDRGVVDRLDPAASCTNEGYRLGLDCTEKWAEERQGVPWPRRMHMPETVRKKTRSIIESISSQVS